MKILLLLKEDIQVNRKTSVLKEVPTDLESVDKTYELNPKFLNDANLILAIYLEKLKFFSYFKLCFQILSIKG